jgi:DNA-binding transcriptional regulator YdaS (Cro superfamily)
VPEVYIRTLQRAVEIVGGEQPLALRIKVTPSHLSLWLQGLEDPPTEVFLRAVDLVSEHEFGQLGNRRPPPAPD